MKNFKFLALSLTFLFASNSNAMMPRMTRLTRAAKPAAIALGAIAIFDCGKYVYDRKNALALQIAIDNKDVNGVKEIITAFTNVNFIVDKKFKQSLLMQAALSGNTEIMELLLNAGAKINSVNKFGLTPLMFSVLSYNPEAVNLLLNKNANVDAASNLGLTSLMYATRSFNNPAIVDALLNKRANTLNVDKDGKTALKYAIETGCINAVKSLINADTTVNDIKNGVNTIIISAFNYPEIVAVLLQSGAIITMPMIDNINQTLNNKDIEKMIKATTDKASIERLQNVLKSAKIIREHAAK